MVLFLILALLQQGSVSQATAATGWSDWSARAEIYNSNVGTPSPALLQLNNGQSLLAYFRRSDPAIQYRITSNSAEWSLAEKRITDPAVSSAVDPTLAQSGNGTVVVAYAGWTTSSVIRVARSADLEHWSAPQTVVSLPWGSHAWAPNLIALSDGKLFLTFAYGLEGSRAGLAYVQSSDGGNTWSTPALLFDNPAAYDSKPNAVELADGSILCSFYQGPSYYNDRELWGNRDIYALRLTSGAGGASWQAVNGAQPVYTNPASADSWPAVLKLAGGDIWLAFTASRDLSSDGLYDLQIKLVRALSEDGSAWGEAETISADTGSESWPALAQLSNGTVLAVWDSDAWLPGTPDYQLWQKTASDISAPEILQITPSGAIMESNTSLRVDYRDSGAGIEPASAHLSLDGAPVSGCAVNTASISCTVTGLAYGPHEITGAVADKAGNTAAISGTFQVSDTAAPVSSLGEPSGAVLSGSAVVRTAFSDAAPSSGVDTDSLRLVIDGIDVTAAASKTGQEISYTPNPALAAGHHRVHAEAIDGAGNRGSVDWSFNVAPQRSYFTWYDGIAASDWVLMANPFTAAGDAWFNLYLSGVEQSIAPLPGLLAGQAPAGRVLVSIYPSQRQGPLWVAHTAPALISQRIHWKSSFEEVVGFDYERLANHYYWTWYDDSVTPNMLDWVLIANPDTESPVSYEIKMAGQPLSCDAAYPCPEAPASGVIAPGGKITARFPGRQGGPLEVVASGRVLASQRVHLNFGRPNEAFSETVGTPATELSGHYWWAWYDDFVTPGMLNWVLVANPNSYAVDYQIRVAGETKASGTLPPLGSRDAQGKPLDIVTPRFTGSRGGPVEMIGFRNGTTDPANVIASQRVHLGASFSELAGYRDAALSGDYHWTWYDDLVTPGMLNWVLIANINDYQVNYEIRIAGALAGSGALEPAGSRDAQGKPLDIVLPRFAGSRGGPVEVIARQSGTNAATRVIASQRVHLGSYLNEVMGTVLD